MKPDIKTYKVPQDVNTEFFRIVFAYNIKHKVKSAHSEDNILTIEVDFSGTKRSEPKQNIETMLEDYREYMRNIVGDTILNLTEDNEGDY